MPALPPVMRATALVRFMALFGAVRYAGYFGVGRGCYRYADFSLLVAFDSRLGGAAAFFTPDERDFRAGLGEGYVDHRQRDHGAFVIGVAGVGGDADGFAVLHDFVVGERGVVGWRHVDVLHGIPAAVEHSGQGC